MASQKIIVTNDKGEGIEYSYTDKELLYCQFYVQSTNGSAAARKAGYSKDSAHVTSSKLLRKANIIAYIEEYRRNLYAENKMTIEELTHFLSETLRVDPLELFEDNGKLKPLDEMSKRARMLIDGIDVDEVIMGEGDGIITKRKVKLRSKDSSAEKLAKILGAYEMDNKQKITKVNFYLPDNGRPIKK